jgi:hypothetical protein
MVVVFDHVRSRRSDLPAWSKERYSSLERAPARRRHCASGTIRAEQPIQLVSASQRPNAADDTDRIFAPVGTAARRRSVTGWRAITIRGLEGECSLLG